MKEKIEFQSVVAETLLIPLYMRAKESRRRDAVLHDPEAERLSVASHCGDGCGRTADRNSDPHARHA